MAPVRQVRSTDARMRQVVKSVLNSRTEHKQTAIAFTAATAVAGVVIPVTQNIIQGDAIDQRAGNVIKLEAFKMFMTATAISVQTSTLRVIVFSDKFNLGILPVVTDVLAAATPTAAYNPTNAQSKRFKIHSDFYLLTASGNGGAGPSINGLPGVACKQLRIRMKDLVHYLGGTFAVTSNGANSMYILLIDNVASGSTYNVGYNLIYTDI